MCASEVSDIEVNIWQAYMDQGLMVLGIGTEDLKENVEQFALQFGPTFPVLYDEGSVVFRTSYVMESLFGSSLFPQVWVVGVDGTLVFHDNQHDLDTLSAVVEAELAKMP